jgi:ABC-type multidrug transport system fused ATPase/permease subunit
MFEVIAFVWSHLDHFRTRIVRQFFLSIIDGIFLAAVPLLLSEFTKKDFDAEDFLRVFLLVSFCYGMTLPLQWITRRYGETYGQQFANYLRIKLFKRAEKLPLQTLHDYHSGYLLSLINRISDEMPAFISIDVLWSFTRTLVNVVLLFVVTLRESLGMAFLNLFFLGMFLYFSSVLGKRMTVFAHDTNTKRAVMIQRFSDFMANIMTVKRLGVSSFAEKQLVRTSDDTDGAIVRTQAFHAFRWFILHSIYGVMLLGTVGFFLYLIAHGTISSAVLIVFVSIFVMLRSNIGFLGEAVKKMFELKAYIRNLNDILAHSDIDDTARARAPKDWHTITMSDVEMTYAGTEKIIAIPRFLIHKGQKICIAGISGQGKSTFLNLLARFYDPQKGHRAIDGIPYEHIARSFFVTNMAMISQEVEMFSLSVRDNIALGETISDEHIIDTLGSVDLRDWLENLADGLDTLVGEKGIKLSAGQKQRINLVRGLLLDRDIYLLDEPTSHLDADTEEKVIQFLEKRLKRKTAIIVSHRPAVQRLCSRIYTFQHHEMKEV